MIKTKSFPIKDYEKVNEFLSKQAARTSSGTGNSSIMLHNGHYVIFYEDGTGMSTAERISSLRNLLREEEGKLLFALFELRSIDIILTPLVPKGYKQEMADYELKKLILAEHEALAPSMASEIVKKIVGLENQKAASRATVAKVKFSIEALLEMIREDEKLLK